MDPRDWQTSKNRFRCTSCGKLCANRSTLFNHYMKCFTWIPMSRRRAHINEHLAQKYYDIFDGTSFSVDEGKQRITRKEKAGPLARYYRIFGDPTSHRRRKKTRKKHVQRRKNYKAGR